MEFNRDVLGVIREFSMPRMRFVNEFAAVHRNLRDKNIKFCPILHAQVKAKLMGPRAEYVFQCFMVYIDSLVRLNESIQQKTRVDWQYSRYARDYLMTAIWDCEPLSFDQFRREMSYQMPYNTDENGF